MEYVVQFFLVSLIAATLQNPFFARALGTSRTSIFIKSPRLGILFGVILTSITVLASIPSYGVMRLLSGVPNVIYFRMPCYIVIICVVYLLAHLILRKAAPAILERIGAMLPLATFNCGVLGALLVANDSGYNLIQSIGFGFGSGVGFTMALLIIYIARRRIKLSDVPIAFRGQPVIMVYIGILALAIYGLLGHQLAN